MISQDDEKSHFLAVFEPLQFGAQSQCNVQESPAHGKSHASTDAGFD
jgi:hypothetical protein